MLLNTLSLAICSGDGVAENIPAKQHLVFFQCVLQTDVSILDHRCTKLTSKTGACRSTFAFGTVTFKNENNADASRTGPNTVGAEIVKRDSGSFQAAYCGTERNINKTFCCIYWHCVTWFSSVKNRFFLK